MSKDNIPGQSLEDLEFAQKLSIKLKNEKKQ